MLVLNAFLINKLTYHTAQCSANLYLTCSETSTSSLWWCRAQRSIKVRRWRITAVDEQRGRTRRSVDVSFWDSGSQENACTSFSEVTQGPRKTGASAAPTWRTISGTLWSSPSAAIVWALRWTAGSLWKCKFVFLSTPDKLGRRAVCLLSCSLPVPSKLPAAIVDLSPQHNGAPPNMLLPRGRVIVAWQIVISGNSLWQTSMRNIITPTCHGLLL